MRMWMLVAVMLLGGMLLVGCGGDKIDLCEGCDTPSPTPTSTPVEPTSTAPTATARTPTPTAPSPTPAATGSPG